MKGDNTFHDELQDIIKTKSLHEVFNFMEESFTYFFSTPYISNYYKIIKDIDVSKSEKVMPKLIKAWLAFLSGDNFGFGLIIKSISKIELKGYYDSSTYYSLVALGSFLSDSKQGLKYAKLSIDILPEEDASVYTANAKLTYGQLLSSDNQYRAAAEVFRDSYNTFYKLDVYFPAAVALVNELLNRYKLGEFYYVIDECKKALVMSSNFMDESYDYWDIINLPLGMCYYEMNKPSLAIRHLRQAKQSIDKIKLFHMHGLIEKYLFKSYYIQNDTEGMKEVLNKTCDDFKNMNYTMTDLLISMFRILSCQEDSINLIQPDIEQFELEYMKSGSQKNFAIIEVLSYLKLRGLSDSISIGDILKCLEKQRFTGMVPNIQLLLVILAEMYYAEDNQNDSAQCLKEAVSIYKEYDISTCFYMIPLKSVSLIKKIDMKLYNALSKAHSQQIGKREAILSPREREVMELIAAGKSNDEISQALFIGVGTIKWHINHIFSKFDVKNRVQAIEKAKSIGEISKS